MENGEELDLTVSSSRLADKNAKLKKSSEPQNSKFNQTVNIYNPLINTTPIRTDFRKPTGGINLQEFMDSSAFGDRNSAKNEESSDLIIQHTKEAILEKVFFMQFHEVLDIEKSMMKEIIQKDIEREKFLQELMVKLELLQRDNQILTAENKSLKEMMVIWKVIS